MVVFQEKQNLDEMARICQKSDGYGIVVELYSRDHGKIGNPRQPAHAHLLDTNMNELGEFELTQNAPQKTSDVVWYRTKNPPTIYAANIVKWAQGSKRGVNNWILALLNWESHHPK